MTTNYSELFSDYKKAKTIEEVKKSFRIKNLVMQCKSGNYYQPVFKILSEAKRQGLSDNDAVLLVLSYNFGAEYSDYNSLMTKIKRCS